MTIEAVVERYGGLIKKVTDLTPEIEEFQRGSYQDPKSPSITYFPRPPHIVTRFRDNNGGLFAGGIDMYVESAEARTPDTVVQTVFELDSLNGGRVTAEKTLTRGEINETNLSEGNWKRKTTWRWRP